MITVDTRVIPISKPLVCFDSAWVIIAVDVTALNSAGFTVTLTAPNGTPIGLITAAGGADILMTQVIDPTSPPATTQVTLGAATGGTIQLTPNPFGQTGAVKALVPWNWKLTTNYGADTPIQILRFSSLKEALDYMK